ncbi:unnamed protein product [Linum trigynum]|uniref:Uncharacterized protein n=1 Tax=Linum trigynum TaxID=586398 RepID=A0AAV2FAI5_9ROSI
MGINMAMLTDHVNINTPCNMAPLKTTSAKVKKLSKGQCGQQHGHVRDHVNINNPATRPHRIPRPQKSKSFQKVNVGSNMAMFENTSTSTHLATGSCSRPRQHQHTLQHGHVEDHVNKSHELSKGQCGQQHGHYRDHVHMNTPFNVAMLKTT